jgi:putative molybdopterin biosynthesis protein
MADDLLTAQEAADYLRVKKTTVYELVKRGSLPSTKIGKQVRIPRAALEEMVGAGQSLSAPAKPPLREGGHSSAILCGQDASLDLIANHVTACEGNGAVVLRSHAGSYNSLTMLYHGKVDMATAHLWDEKTGVYNLPYIEKLLPGVEVTAVRLFGRTTGIYVPTGNPKGVEGVSALSREDLVMVNREKGSGVRVLVDEKRRALGLSPRQIRGYGNERTSHTTVAAAVANHEADYGFGAEAASRQVDGVDFIPLQLEWYDLVMPTSRREEPAFRAVLEYVTSPQFRRELGQTGRYDLSQTGLISEL